MADRNTTSRSSRQPFSTLAVSMSAFGEETLARQTILPVPPWEDAERTDAKRRQRVTKASKPGDAAHCYFSRLYYPPALYRGGYAEPGQMHREIVRLFETPGVHWVLGSRKTGKTVTGKREFIRQFVSDRHRFGGVYGETLIQARNLLEDILYLIQENGRLMADFGITILRANSDTIRFRVHRPDSPAYDCIITAFSQERSIRGHSKLFDRPGLLLIDDLETRTSPIGDDHTRRHASIIAEARGSLSTNGVIVAFGNNWHEDTYGNSLVQEQRNGLLPPSYSVHVYPAWSDEHGSVWPERYPATSEAEMRQMLEPADESEWAGDYQQDPQPPNGFVFLREYYQELPEGAAIPDDARGVLYGDQNLAPKRKGDTTGSLEYLFSPSTQDYYVGWAFCDSIDDPNLLLVMMLAARSPRVLRMGLDGHVSQEAHWRAHIRSYCTQHAVPFPHVEWCRYRVDACAGNLQAIWVARRVWFPHGFAQTPHGRRALKQMFSFTTKRAGRPDDWPDAMINANEMIHATGFVRPQSSRQERRTWTVSITEDRRLF